MPGHGWLLGLSLRAKLGLVVAILAAPVLVLVGLQFSQRQATITHTTSEQSGLAYLDEAVFPLITKLERHRMLAGAVAAGNVGVAPQLQTARDEVDAAVAVLTERDKAHGKSWGTSRAVAEVATRWAVARNVTSRGLVDQTVSLDTAILQEQLLPIVFTAGNASRLFVDPDIETRNAIAGLTEHWLRFEEEQTRAAAYSAIATGNDGGVQFSARLQASRAILSAEASGQAMRGSFAAAGAADSAYERALHDPLLASQQQADATKSLLNSIATNDGLLVTQGRVLEQSAKLTDTNAALYRAASRQVRSDFSARVNAGRAVQFVTLGGSLAALALAISLAGFISRSVTGPILQLVEAADRMSLGELDVDIPVNSKNEIGQLAESLRRMQVSLRGAIERLRARRAA